MDAVAVAKSNSYTRGDATRNLHFSLFRIAVKDVNAQYHYAVVRFFLTKEEKIKKLEEYTQELKNELAAVQERIKELKAK